MRPYELNSHLNEPLCTHALAFATALALAKQAPLCGLYMLAWPTSGHISTMWVDISNLELRSFKNATVAGPHAYPIWYVTRGLWIIAATSAGCGSTRRRPHAMPFQNTNLPRS
ncbi:hypothetical protein ACVWXO_000543 [Bradyrhizobium sp. LM2.7]